MLAVEKEKADTGDKLQLNDLLVKAAQSSTCMLSKPTMEY
jgi:hypothetical protein